MYQGLEDDDLLAIETHMDWAGLGDQLGQAVDSLEDQALALAEVSGELPGHIAQLVFETFLQRRGLA